MEPAQAALPERSLGELFGELARETGSLVRSEVQLAATEMTQKATEAAKDAGLIGAGAALAHTGLLALMGGIIVALSQFMALWLSALLVGAVMLGVGYALAQKGITALKHFDPTPRATVQTIKEDKLWAQHQTR